MNQEIDFSALRAYSGEYHSELVSALYNELDAQAEGLIILPGVKGDLNINKLAIEGGLKPFTGDFVPRKKSGSYKERILSVKKVQRDDRIFPSEYLPYFMAKQRRAGENPNNQSIPFEQFFWESIMKRDATDLNTEAVYWGVDASSISAFNGASTYSVGNLVKFTQDGEVRYFRCITATSAGESPDTHAAKWAWAGSRVLGKGFNERIKDAISASEVKTVVTGAITSADAYAQYQSVWRLLPETVRMGKYGKVEIDCSMNSYEALTDDYENKIKKNFEEVDGVTYLAKTNKVCVVRPRSWMVGSGRLIARVPDNFWIGTDQAADMNTMKVIDEMYSFQVGKSFMWGTQISNTEMMATNTNE